MKIAIYAIAKDEDRVAQRFADSVRDADYKLVVDTGSTDRTEEILSKNGIVVVRKELNPFRFDVARNLSLKGLPPDIDIAIALDLDDVLVENWRQIVEDNWEEGITRLMYLQNLYPYNDYSHPSRTQRGFKVHKPDTYLWVDPIHEWLKPVKEDNSKFIDDVLINHYPIRKDSRECRISLAQLGIEENPLSVRLSYYYGSELFGNKFYREAIDEFKRCLSISEAYTEDKDVSIATGRSNVCKFLAFSLMELKADPNEVIKWLLRYVSEYPFDREAWFELAKGWKAVGKYTMAYGCAKYGMLLGKDINCASYSDWCWGNEAVEFVEELDRLSNMENAKR